MQIRTTEQDIFSHFNNLIYLQAKYAKFGFRFKQIYLFCQIKNWSKQASLASLIHFFVPNLRWLKFVGWNYQLFKWNSSNIFHFGFWLTVTCPPHFFICRPKNEWNGPRSFMWNVSFYSGKLMFLVFSISKLCRQKRTEMEVRPVFSHYSTQWSFSVEPLSM